MDAFKDIFQAQKRYRGKKQVPIEELFEDLGIEIPKEVYRGTCPDCGSPLDVRSEKRSGGYTEDVAYCSGCGRTETTF